MKKIMMTAAVLVAMMATATAQVFVMDEKEQSSRTPGTEEEINLIVPIHGVDYDQYTPVGGGVLLLAGLGGAYLLAKRKKD